MAKITYDNKEIYTDGSTNSQYFRFQDANEIKSVVNENDTNLERVDTRLERIYEIVSQETTQTGTEITIDNTFADSMQLVLKGNADQYTTEGKNLIDTNNFETIEQRGLTITMNNDGTFNIVGRSTSRGGIDIGNNFADKLVNGHTYAEFCTDYSTTLNLYCRLTYRKPDQSIQNVAITPTTKATINTSVNTLEIARILLWVDVVGVDYDYHNIKIMIGEGTTLTEDDYEPFTDGASPNPLYPQEVKVVTGSNTITISNDGNSESQILPVNLGSLELCKIGNFQDYIYKSGDKWYKHEVIEKIILNGTQGSWTKGSVSGEVYSVFQANWGLNKYVKNTTQILSDKVTGGNANSAPLTGEHIQIGGQISAPIRISILNSRLSEVTSNGFNTFLTNNNFTCYIPLATPTEIEITDTTLKEQLNNILTAQSYDYQTNITQTNAVLPFIITATARVERN